MEKHLGHLGCFMQFDIRCVVSLLLPSVASSTFRNHPADAAQINNRGRVSVQASFPTTDAVPVIRNLSPSPVRRGSDAAASCYLIPITGLED